MVRVVVRGLIYDLRTSKTDQKQAEHDSGGANRPLRAEELAETEPSDDRLYGNEEDTGDGWETTGEGSC